MKYLISDSSITRINETEGTIQIATEGAKIEISDSADFTDVFILSSLTPKNFSKQLYIRGYGEVENPVEVNVVNFNISEGGGGGGEGLSAEDTEAIANAFKSAKVEGNTVSFYVDSDTTGTPAFYFDFPEEIFLDQVGTRLVENFSWSALAYPNSVNPNLDGKIVLVLAVKGDKEVNPTTKFSFVNLEKLIDTYTASDTSITITDYKVKANISAATGNALEIKADGLYVDALPKVENPTAGNVPLLATDGTLINSTVVGADILTKDSSTTAGNIAVFDSEGGIADSTFSISEIAVAASDSSVTISDYKAKANISAVANNSLTLKNDGLHVDISGKVDKVTNATAGNVALLESDGSLINSAISGDDVIVNVKYNEKEINFLNADNVVKATVKLPETKIAVRYGYKIKKTEPDPYARVEYIYDAVGFTPAYMNFESDEFNYGSWADVWFIKDIKPLMLKYDGTVDYYLYENDYSIKANGDDVTTPSTDADSDSDVANTDYEGNAMAQIPLIWVKRYEDDDYIYEIVSNVKWDKNYKAYAHTNANGDIKNYFYYSMFDGSGSASSIRSLSGKTVGKSLTAAQMIQGATANGSGWYIHSWCQRELIRTLCVLLGKSTNTQARFGTGRTINSGSTDSTITTGTLTNKGMFWGASANTSAVKVFHIENFWGNQWDRTAGLIMNYTDGYVYVKMTPEGAGYRVTDVNGMTKTTAVPATGESQYVQSCTAAAEGADDFGVIPVGFTSGSASTYYCDGYWRRSGSAYPSGNIGYLFAGSSSAHATAISGAFTFFVTYAPSYAYWNFGCGLSYIG